MTGTTGTVNESNEAVLTTLLVSDLVNSTKMVEELGDQRAFALFGRHDRMARDLLEQFNGREIDKTDGFLLIFERPVDAVRYAAAHSVGVLHKDLKPGNVLVRLDQQGAIRARLTDFGIGMVTDTSKLAAAGITMLGFGETGILAEASATGGTQLYMAPELLEGQPASVQADTFALGVMLHQLVVGNLKHALAPGWERNVDDELLREEIAKLVDGDPARRERDPADVARRLRHLDDRRQAQEEPQHPTHARSLVTLARILAERGEAAEAEELLRRALAMQEAILGAEHPLVAVSLRHLAGVLAARAELGEADAFVERALTIARSRLGERHQLTAELLTTRGGVDRLQGRLGDAEQHLETALSILGETMGADNPENVQPLMELARVRVAQGRPAEAREMLGRALELETAHRGADHPSTAAIRSHIEELP